MLSAQTSVRSNAKKPFALIPCSGEAAGAFPSKGLPWPLGERPPNCTASYQGHTGQLLSSSSGQESSEDTEALTI